MNIESQVLNVPIEDIIPNRFQPRINFDSEALQELASSIKEHGIIQPLVLRRLGDKFEIIAGERRYKAAKIAGLTSVPAIISSMDDKKSAEVAIVENIQRKDLSAIEEAKSYKALLDKGYLTQEELAKKMGISQSAVSNKMRLLSLSENVQKALMEGKISERHARSLLKINDKSEQDKWLNTIIEERLTVKALDNRLKEIMKEEEEDTIKVIENSPNIEEIKNSAQDIKGETNSIPISENKIPNKFFNFLEDEQANMTTNEEAFSTPSAVEPQKISPIPDDQPSINEPIIEPQIYGPSVQEEKPLEEEIEMLDFSPTTNNNLNREEIGSIINKLEDELKQKNYKVNIVKEDNNNSIKYTIEVEN